MVYCPVVNLLARGGIHDLLTQASIGNPLFDSIMTSASQVWHYGLDEERLMKRMHRYESYREQCDNTILVDSGGYTLRDDKHKTTRIMNDSVSLEDDILSIQRLMNPDLYFPLDYPNGGHMNEQQTIQNHVRWLHEKLEDSLLFAVIHWNGVQGVDGYLQRLDAEIKRAGYSLMDFDGFAIGGTTALRGNYQAVKEVVIRVIRVLAKRSALIRPLHILGNTMFSLQKIPFVFGFDSMTYLFSAINGMYLSTDGNLHIDKVEDIESIYGNQVNLFRNGALTKTEMAFPLALHNLRVLQKSHDDVRYLPVEWAYQRTLHIDMESEDVFEELLEYVPIMNGCGREGTWNESYEQIRLRI